MTSQAAAEIPSASGHLFSGSLCRVRSFISRFGWGEVVRKPLRRMFAPWILRGLRPATFALGGETFPLFFHHHNTTWANERAVEVPIAIAVIATSPGRLLEVGNVLSHYVPTDWTVVDRYEQADGVVRADITSWEPEARFDLAVSISTLEHIGFDEEDQDPTGQRIIAAIDNVRERCLTDEGKFVFTVPIGYNPALDRLIRDGHKAFASGAFLKRTGHLDWREVSREEATGSRFGSPLPYANAIMIGTVSASDPARSKTPM